MCNSSAPSSHPQYKRWRSIVERCHNEKTPSYKDYGARGICVDERWAATNPHGFANFFSWIEAQVLQYGELLKVDGEVRFEVVRKTAHDHYGPDTCILQKPGLAGQKRRSSVLTNELVVSLRRHKKQNPFQSLSRLEKVTGISVANLSRCLRGITWFTADALEPPLKSLLPEDLIDAGFPQAA